MENVLSILSIHLNTTLMKWLKVYREQFFKYYQVFQSKHTGSEFVINQNIKLDYVVRMGEQNFN